MRLPWLLSLAAATASALQAQSVDLQVRESSTLAPVAGAIVRLIGATGVVSQGLTNEQGRVALSGSGAGKYRLKIDRIGWSGVLTDPFDLAVGQAVQRELMMVSKAIALPELVVRGKSTCILSDAGSLTTVLWGEITKALTANFLTQRQGRLPLHVRLFTRELGVSGALLREWVTASAVVRGRPPFKSLPPALLAEAGFVQSSEGDSVTYAAPDAELLLSEEFVKTHCFRVVPVRNGLMGLEFVPAPGRKVSDVSGTLWVDRATDDLKFIDYSYTGIEPELKDAGLGGRVEFLRLPTGVWIISYWYTRTPRLVSEPRRGHGATGTVVRLVGLLDRGGRAELAAAGDGSLDRAIVFGRIYDSTETRGLAGAMVRVVGYPDSVTTDADGRFELAVPLSGDQVVTAVHPKLGLIQDRPIRPVLLSIGDTTSVGFGVPSVATFVRSFCGSFRGRGVLVGILLKPDGSAAADLEVFARWLTSDGFREERERSGPRGAFALCNLAPGPTLPIKVSDGRRVLLEQKLTLELNERRWMELRLPPVLP